MAKQPFTIAIPDEVLKDLHQRLKRTRWPSDLNNKDWAYGTNKAYLEELVDYWINTYDWRKHEQEMNSFANYKTTIDDVPIHFIYEPGKGPNPKPLILSHGWPWSFWDLKKMIRPLSDPASFGGNPEDAFDVIVPSLPGYGFSTPLTKTGINYIVTADLWVKLMRDELGYDRFGAQGGDWGAFVTAQMGHKYADQITGIHLNFPATPGLLDQTHIPTEDDYGPDEQDWPQKSLKAQRTGSSHMAVHMTDPQTLAYGMHDSPVALCAWILERRRAWSDSHGDVESRFSKVDLITTMMIYWVTESFVTSVRYYYEMANNPWTPSYEGLPLIKPPTGVAVFPEELVMRPRKWAERVYNLKQWTVMPAGGHFAHAEEPERLTEDIRSFFRGLS